MQLAFDRDRFLTTLRRLIGFAEELQNAPSANLVPKEILACNVVTEALQPLASAGFLTMKNYSADGMQARPSLIITVPGHEAPSVGLVGAHFDVVPADRVGEGWTTNPFELVVETDGTLRGRGVTDCLGHVALLTELLLAIYETGAKPKRTIHVVMIANEEERAVPGIGLEYLGEIGALDPLQSGPIYWLDSADFGPTLGTGGIATWELRATGVPGHSGMPHNCVNALELGMAAVQALVDWFRNAVPPHPDEKRWQFSTPSTCKPTVVICDNNKITKIPGQVRIFGDMRITPFHDIADIFHRAKAFIARLNDEIQSDSAPLGFPRTRTEGGAKGKVELVSEGKLMEGIACNLESPALAKLSQAIARIRGASAVHPYSMTGSLPLVRDLQRRGFDVQITGFGESRSYHAPNEQGKLEDFEDGFRILEQLVM